MTAICKTILIHGTNLQNILDYGSDQEKTSVTNNGLADVLEYGANPLKTLADFADGHQGRGGACGNDAGRLRGAGRDRRADGRQAFGYAAEGKGGGR